MLFRSDDPSVHGNITCVIACPSLGGRYSTATTLIRVMKTRRLDNTVEILDDWKEFMAKEVERVTKNKRAPPLERGNGSYNTRSLGGLLGPEPPKTAPTSPTRSKR